MQADIIALEEKLDLDTQQLSVYIVLKLQDGQEYRVEASTELAEALVGLTVSNQHQAPPPAPMPVISSPPMSELEDDHDMVFGGFEEPPNADDPPVDWSALPDDQLSPKMKKALAANRIPRTLRASQLVAIVEQLAEKMIEELEAQSQQKAPKPPQAQVGVVQRPPQVAPIRSVPSDEMGYPRVAQISERDPGEIALHGTDEDGIAQV